MYKLSNETFNKLRSYMDQEARPLEKAMFNYYFNNSNDDEILDILEGFQNSDGGFGRGIEPDFKLIKSSPMGTSIGLRYLDVLSSNTRAQKMIGKAIKYLELTFESGRNGWYSVPATVNDYPHAPHWEYIDDIGMTVIDYSWGNPTAELIGYLYKYRGYVTKLDSLSLLKYAIDNINRYTEFKSEHEIFCYIRMYNTIDKEFAIQIEEALRLAISQLINTDESQWGEYVPMPLKFIEFDSKNYFAINEKAIDKNLDYFVVKLEENKKMLPTWEWDDYLDEWKIAKEEWIGILSLEALLALKKFNRLQI